MEEKQDCPCRYKSCKRHGKCEACRAHHRKENKLLPRVRENEHHAGNSRKTSKRFYNFRFSSQNDET